MFRAKRKSRVSVIVYVRVSIHILWGKCRYVFVCVIVCVRVRWNGSPGFLGWQILKKKFSAKNFIFIISFVFFFFICGAQIFHATGLCPVAPHDSKVSIITEAHCSRDLSKLRSIALSLFLALSLSLYFFGSLSLRVLWVSMGCPIKCTKSCALKRHPKSQRTLWPRGVMAFLIIYKKHTRINKRSKETRWSESKRGNQGVPVGQHGAKS